MWRCPGCGETVEPPFGVCWRCGTSQDGERDPHFKTAEDVSPAETAALSRFELPAAKAGDEETSAKYVKFRLWAMFVAVGVSAAVAWSIQPRTSHDFFLLANAHLTRGEFEGAIADLTRAIELADQERKLWNLPTLYAARALAHNNRGDYAGALRDISRAIEMVEAPQLAPGVHLTPRDAHGNPIIVSEEELVAWHLMRAHASIGVGEPMRAIADIEWVLSLDPSNRAAAHLLAVAEGRKPIRR